MTKILQKENGSGLVLTLMVLVVLSVLGSALGVVTVGSYRLGDINRDSTSAYYIAEAGANMAYEELKEIVQSAYEDPDSVSDQTFYRKIKFDFTNFNKEYSTEFKIQSGEQPEAIVTIEGPRSEGEKEKYTIVSRGKISNKTRKVEKILEVSWVDKEIIPDDTFPINIDDSVITFNNQLIRKNHFDVKGKIRHDGTGLVSSTSGLNIVEDKNINWENYSTQFEKFIPTEFTDQRGEVSGQEKLHFEGDTLIERLVPGKNTQISFDEDVLNLVVKDLYIDNHFKSLSITGSGKINLFVTEELTFHNGANSEIKFNGDGTANKLNIFYSGKSDLEFKGKFTFKGGLFIKDQNAYFRNHATIHGNIISGGQIIEFVNHADIFHQEVSLNKSNTENTEIVEVTIDELISTKPAIEQ